MTRYLVSLAAASIFSISLLADPIPKAVAYYAPKPEYPAEARARNIEGSGMFVLHINPRTGRVTSVSIEKSTGSAILDKAAIDSYMQWRFNRGVPMVKCPITFTAHGLPSDWKIVQ